MRGTVDDPFPSGPQSPLTWPDVKARACSLLHLAKCQGRCFKRGRVRGILHKQEARGLISWCLGFKGKMRLGMWRKWQHVVRKGKWEVGNELRDKREKESV